jgi:hypothetical protein
MKMSHAHKIKKCGKFISDGEVITKITVMTIERIIDIL